MKKAVIFGISGQDGSHLADLLLSKNYEVVGVVRFSSVASRPNLKHLENQKGLTLEAGDITDPYSINRVLTKHNNATEVYNLAAQSHVGASFKEPHHTMNATGIGCINIMQSIVDLGLVDTMRFYQASSSEMFGKAHDEKTVFVEYQDAGEPGARYVSDVVRHTEKYQDENTRFLPQSPYAIAKCAAHYGVRLYRESYGLHASAGILFNHEGPRRGENFVTRKITKWIGEFSAWRSIYGKKYDYIYTPNEIIATKDEIMVYSHFPKLMLGNLDSYRDWGYAGDYVEAMWMMLQQEAPDDYVICTGETHSVRDFLTAAFKEAKIDDWTKYVGVDKKFYRPAEVDYLRGDCSKAREKLGWQPKHSFNELVSMMVKYDLELAREKKLQ